MRRPPIAVTLVALVMIALGETIVRSKTLFRAGPDNLPGPRDQAAGAGRVAGPSADRKRVVGQMETLAPGR